MKPLSCVNAINFPRNKALPTTLHMNGYPVHTTPIRNARKPMSPSGLALLEDRIDQLIKLCEELAVENRALRAKQQSLTVDRAKLIEKNELAKTRVESMINRLKALEKTP